MDEAEVEVFVDEYSESFELDRGERVESTDVSRSEVLGQFYNPNTTPKRQKESSGLPAWNWTGVALKGVLHQGD